MLRLKAHHVRSQWAWEDKMPDRLSSVEQHLDDAKEDSTKRAVDVPTYELLYKNGVRVGVAPSTEWTYLKGVLARARLEPMAISAARGRPPRSSPRRRNVDTARLERPNKFLDEIGVSHLQRYADPSGDAFETCAMK